VPIDSLEISSNLDLDDASSTSLAASQVPIVSDSTVLVPTDHESSDSMILSSAPSDLVASDLQNSASQETSFHSSMPTHPMVTRSKGGIVCPKQFPDYRTYYSTKHPLCALHSITVPIEPTSFKQATKFGEWQLAMHVEFDALQANHTWDLCSKPSEKNVIQTKWVYKVKQLKV
jgi:hypothetical protein